MMQIFVHEIKVFLWSSLWSTSFSKFHCNTERGTQANQVSCLT